MRRQPPLPSKQVMTNFSANVTRSVFEGSKFFVLRRFHAVETDWLIAANSAFPASRRGTEAFNIYEHAIIWTLCVCWCLFVLNFFTKNVTYSFNAQNMKKSFRLIISLPRTSSLSKSLSSLFFSIFVDITQIHTHHTHTQMHSPAHALIALVLSISPSYLTFPILFYSNICSQSSVWLIKTSSTKSIVWLDNYFVLCHL